MSGSNTKRRRVAAEALMGDIAKVFMRHKSRGLTLLEMCGYLLAFITNVIAKKYGHRAAREILISLADRAENLEQIGEGDLLVEYLANVEPMGRA